MDECVKDKLINYYEFLYNFQDDLPFLMFILMISAQNVFSISYETDALLMCLSLVYLGSCTCLSPLHKFNRSGFSPVKV